MAAMEAQVEPVAKQVLFFELMPRWDCLAEMTTFISTLLRRLRMYEVFQFAKI